MRFKEINQSLNVYMATIRIVCGASSTVVNTIVDAASQTQARALLCHLYGQSNVLSISQQMAEDAPKVLSPQEQQVKSMSDQAKRLQQQAKQIKARSKLQKAQQQLASATLGR